jgi:hypothetical protein
MASIEFARCVGLKEANTEEVDPKLNIQLSTLFF